MRLPSSRSEGEEALESIACQVQLMGEAEEEAARHAALVHATAWVERAAGGGRCEGSTATAVVP